MAKNQCKVLNMFFHTPSLLHGNNPFVRTEADEEVFLERIRVFLDYTVKENIPSITLAEAEELYS